MANKSKNEGVRGNAANDPRLTVDVFIGEVAIEPRRCILVYLREHAGKRYVRWRVFHQHTEGGYRYPDKRRAFVIPEHIAESLARMIAAAPSGQPQTRKPAWLADVERGRQREILILKELNAPAHVLKPRQRRLRKGLA